MNNIFFHIRHAVCFRFFFIFGSDQTVVYTHFVCLTKLVAMPFAICVHIANALLFDISRFLLTSQLLYSHVKCIEVIVKSAERIQISQFSRVK